MSTGGRDGGRGAGMAGATKPLALAPPWRVRRSLFVRRRSAALVGALVPPSSTGDDIAAGGTLPRASAVARPRRRRSLRLLLEVVVLYIVVPIAMLHALAEWRLPLFLVLPPLLVTFVAFLLLDPTFSVKREISRAISWRALIGIAGTLVLLGGAVTYYVATDMPQKFLSLATDRPDVYARVMLLYPLLSVLPQEIAYRTFFFHRYGPLFRRQRPAMIVVNGLLFGFAHLLFGNWLAVTGTVLTGMLFAYRYDTTRSLWAVWLEHTLWGWLVFTVGLGSYFFTGVSNLPLGH